jgi:hypothetical protein
MMHAFHPNEGRLAIATERGMECDGRETCRMACDVDADGEGVWSWHPWAGAKSVDDESAGDGDSKVMDTGEITYKP